MRKNLPLHGAKNLRDFGGIVNREGRRIKEKCFLRSDALHKLSEEDCLLLQKDYNLRCIIDLRTAMEREEKPDVVMDGVRYENIPLFTNAIAGLSHEEATNKVVMLNEMPEMSELYRTVIRTDYCVERLKDVFALITTKEEGSMLWHCTEGKDRCGLTSALFLALLDVDKETIIQDYLLTNPVSSKKGRKIAFFVFLLTWSKKRIEKVKRVFEANEEYLRASFDEIETTYGSIDSFMEQRLGITKEIKEKMKALYLE